MLLEPTAIERVTETLWRAPLVTPTIPPATRTNTYVWDTRCGLWIIDPGSPKRRELARLERLLDDELSHRPLAGYVVTHHHPDHWGGLRRLLGRRPAPVVAADPARYGRLEAAFRRPAWLDERLAGEGATVSTPGHASDHIVVRTAAGDVVAGDLVAGVGTVVINPPDGDMSAYLASLRRLGELGVERIFPAHGPTVPRGAAKLREYVDHRLTRERQVIEALRAVGPATAMKLVPLIYQDLALVLRPVAARSVLAHLLKLRDDGRAEQVGGWRWRVIV